VVVLRVGAAATASGMRLEDLVLEIGSRHEL